jgi:transmembrane sensor
MLREALTLERLRAMGPDDAAAWFVAHRAESLSPHEEALLADWLVEDPAHFAALECAGRAWDVFDDAQDNEILAAMRAQALSPPARRWTSWPRMAAAAAVLLVLTTTLLIPVLDRDPETPLGDGVQYASASGEMKDITLPDGSIMTLDADSVVLARFDQEARAIELEKGRVFFDVEPDRSRPFSVAAASRRVVAIGTRFEVDVGAGGLRVTLSQGRVAIEALEPGTETVTLVPGQQFVEAGDRRTILSVATDSNTPPAWRRGLIDLDDRPLSEAVAEVNRYSSEQIVVRDPDIAALRISGQFRAGNAARFAQTVAEVLPVRVVRRENEIELLPSK